VPIEFETDAQKDFYEAVGSDLRQAFGELAGPVEDDVPAYVVALGPADVYLWVAAVGENLAAVDLWCWLDGGGVAITPAVMRYLLERSDGMRIGKLGIDEEGAIRLSHSLFSHGCDKAVLTQAVHTLSGTGVACAEELRRLR
jgi:hypothetical protein